MLRGRQGILKWGVWYSKKSVISLIVVLLYFLKYRRSVLFPNIVVSAFVGFVLNLCHDLSWRITGSKFWYFCNNCSVIFSVGGIKILSTSIFDKGIVSSGSRRSKLYLSCILNYILVVLINLFYQLNFLFLSMEKCLLCVVVVWLFFVE